jgi:hypothetical protein
LAKIRGAAKPGAGIQKPAVSGCAEKFGVRRAGSRTAPYRFRFKVKNGKVGNVGADLRVCAGFGVRSIGFKIQKARVRSYIYSSKRIF